ncbi:MAG TPA: MazG nucleotide pyrophosphohydrolase domain-containing protein, partial [Gemmatimonadaceae bacterium]|nr:MazG nucleotide pyrophosphohydrolase domain-containing protein [Gemmatimonadaceae bacterium]
MEKTHSLDDTLALMRDLRKRCEWDAAQTHESLRPYLIEEAHELDDAIRLEDDKLLREELGDLLLQVLFHSVLAEERGAFSFADVAAGLITKMKGRHPHLYGDAAKEPWERMKS